MTFCKKASLSSSESLRAKSANFSPFCRSSYRGGVESSVVLVVYAWVHLSGQSWDIQWARKPLQCLGISDWGGCGTWGCGNCA